MLKKKKSRRTRKKEKREPQEAKNTKSEIKSRKNQKPIERNQKRAVGSELSASLSVSGSGSDSGWDSARSRPLARTRTSRTRPPLSLARLSGVESSRAGPRRAERARTRGTHTTLHARWFECICICICVCSARSCGCVRARCFGGLSALR